MSSSPPSSAPPVVLLVGSEATLRDDALRSLRERALAGAPRDFNEDRIDLAASGSNPRGVLNACRTLPMLARQRLVIVTGLEDRKAKGFLEELLPEYLDSPADTTCLALCTPKADRRLRWVKRVGELGEVIDCNGPKRPADVRDWIEARIRSLGKKPGRGTAATLFDLVGTDLDRLAFEIDKVCLYVGDTPAIEADQVAEVTATLRPLAVYELTDAIGGRKLADALRVLSRLDRQGEAPLAVLGALANHFRRLLRAHDCRPLDAKSLQQQLSLHPFAARKLAEQARRFEPPRLQRCLAAVRRTDEVLKGAVPLAPQLAIEQLVVSVCS